jgi:cbb3-type cytochrome oxidase subunit 1
MKESKVKCASDNGTYCEVHYSFIEAVQDLKTSIRWIVVIGGGIFTIGLGLASLQYTQVVEGEKVHAQVMVNQALINMHMEMDNE